MIYNIQYNKIYKNPKFSANVAGVVGAISATYFFFEFHEGIVNFRTSLTAFHNRLLIFLRIGNLFRSVQNSPREAYVVP